MKVKKLRWLMAIITAAVLMLSACTGKTLQAGAGKAPVIDWPKEFLKAPEDFSFSMTWGVEGRSSYDSKTGELISENHTNHTEDFTTTYFLSDEEKDELYTMIVFMNPDRYPDSYNQCPGVIKAPTDQFVLSVFYDGHEKTINCIGTDFSDSTITEDGRYLMDFMNRADEILTSTKEWEALPQSELVYL